MVRLPDDAARTTDEAPSALALEVGALLVRGAEAREFSLADIQYLASALRRAGVEVLLPQRPAARDDVGWLTVEYSRCGRLNCRCANHSNPGHGPYVIRHWRDAAGKLRKESLGRLGRARSPTPIAPRLQHELDQLNHRGLDLRFLHDD